MEYDVVVIGGGPAGMMAAGRAGELGASVLLIDRNRSLGLKLLMTGKDRCNLTNNIDDMSELVEKFGKKGRFLFSSLSKFGPRDVMDFFESQGVETKTERGQRVFPQSDKSRDVLDALRGYMKKAGVKIKTNAIVVRFILKEGKIESVMTDDGERIRADKFVVCAGGKSYPKTGSSGDGFKWARSLGHTVSVLVPALTPITLKEEFVTKLEGLGLRHVEISVYKKNKKGIKKIDSGFGDAMFTADGMSGPIILDMSKKIGQEIGKGEIELRIDLKPALDFAKLDRRIQRDFQKEQNKMFKNSLEKLLPQKIIPIIVERSGIDPEKKVNVITKEERRQLVHLVKSFSLNVEGLVGFDKAIITSGGVSLGEIDSKTMRSKIIDNLYFAGEVLDLDGPTGGYNLQVCWSTGRSAGEGVMNKDK